MTEHEDEAGLGEFLQFASDEAVMDEILGRGDYGLCFIVKPTRAGKDENVDWQFRFKIPPALLEDRTEEQAVRLLLDTLKGLVDVAD